MSFISGMGAQALRNVTLEPWRGNTMSADKPTRSGEKVTDGMMIGIGATVGITATARALMGGGAWARIGAGLIGGASLLMAATGVKNLYAKLPAHPAPTPTPKPTPTPSPQPDPTEPVPHPPYTPGPGPTKPDPTPAPKPPTKPDPTQAPAPVEQAPQQTAPRQHVVQPGENLSFIANCFDVDWRDLYSANRDAIGSNPDELNAGMTLTIPASGVKGGAFDYTPTRTPGILPDGLACDPASAKALAQACATRWSRCGSRRNSHDWRDHRAPSGDPSSHRRKCTRWSVQCTRWSVPRTAFVTPAAPPSPRPASRPAGSAAA
ncbi:MAG: LysM peptidoglycan-binding domain-containing protein [Thermoleophilia bacterium]|nr:LysM peptidoglycan-binding domain-containing protein [Thermoleophilia bacterium]